jgi:hypothetical protein
VPTLDDQPIEHREQRNAGDKGRDPCTTGQQ